MAGSLIQLPSNGSTDWSDFVTIVQHSYRNFNFVGLTNVDATGAPAIAAGSYTVINGAMYQLTPSSGGNETITDSGISVGSELYIRTVLSTGSTSLTCKFTTTPPSWDTAKGGYYSTGNDKYLGTVYKNTDGEYDHKYVYEHGKRLDSTSARPYIKKTFEIGTWDMSADSQKDIDVGVNVQRVVGVQAFIKSDLTSDWWYKLEKGNSTGKMSGWISLIGSTVLGNKRAVSLVRYGSGDFNNVTFDSTAINRGYLTIEFVG